MQVSAAADLRRGFNLDLGVMGMVNTTAPLAFCCGRADASAGGVDACFRPSMYRCGYTGTTSTLPARKTDATKLVPTKAARAEHLLALSPRAARKAFATTLVTEAKKHKIDPAKGLRAVSRTIAAAPARPPKRLLPPPPIQVKPFVHPAPRPTETPPAS